MWLLWSLFVLLLLLQVVEFSNGGITSNYIRPDQVGTDLPIESFPPPPPGWNAPEQVHITQGDQEGRAVIISWISNFEHSTTVTFWEAKRKHGSHHARKARSAVKNYRYFTYTSGFIHHATIKNLKHDRKYIYEIGHLGVKRRFFFTTPPKPGPDVPHTFGIMGDLGQTADSNQTLEHYLANPKGQTVLFVGDLSYADDHNHDNVRWDTWGRFVEKSVAYQPWIWTAGNHELDLAPDQGESQPFKPYMHRYPTPYKSSGSTSPLWYSIKRASAYIIVLSSYSSYGKYTSQYQWLQNELPKVNRNETPWLIVLLHSPWYNSNNYHYMEGETMRVQFESWFVQYKVDLVFAGHVHAYERTERVSNIKYNVVNGQCTPVKDPSAPAYITIGDGGNIEGLADWFTEPQPSYSAFRDSFGHAILEIKNRTHAYYTWHRNQDGEPVAADSTWFYNRFWYPKEEPSTSPQE